MPFTPHQRELLLNSCYHDPRLPEYLERILVEGPGEYDWPPAPGHFEDEQIPLHERIWAQIWHQGDIYPATYMAVPVLCGAVAQFPEMNHGRMLSNLLTVEQSRPRFEPLIRPYLEESDLTAYQAALDGLLPHLPAQLRMQDDSTEEGFRTAETVLALLAQITGQHWLGTLLSRGALPLTYEWAQRLTRSFDEETADAVVLPEVMKTAFFLNRNDLPRSLRENHAERQALAAAGQAEPSEDLEF